MTKYRSPLLLPALLLTVTIAASACRNRPPATTPLPAESDMDRARRDSIARADADRRAADERARADAERLERERAAARDRVMRAIEATIYFDYDRSDLSAEARATLDSKIAALESNPSLRIRVAGHTDERGSDEYNLALGQRRAAAAKRYLTQRGIDGGRVETVSFGEEQPACGESGESCWRSNRRDEFSMIGGSLSAQR